MIRIEIDSIPEGSSHFDVVEDASELEVAEDSGIASFESPVRLEIDAVRSSSEIILRGNVGVDVTFDCARCLKPYRTRLEADLDILCLLGEKAASADGDVCREGVIEVPASSRYIDISDEVRTELMVRLPVKPLCGRDCRGLCPMCGVDLNETTCSCKLDRHDGRWDALKKLK